MYLTLVTLKDENTCYLKKRDRKLLLMLLSN